MGRVPRGADRRSERPRGIRAAIFSAVSPLDAATAWAQVQSGFIGLIAQAVVVPLIVIGLRALLVKNDGRA